MSNKKSFYFQLVIILFIVIIVSFSAMLNAYAFRNSCVEAGAENSAFMLSFITERIEYGLKYGRELKNYYEIDQIFDEVREFCGAEEYFITDADENLLYGTGLPEDFADQVEQIEINQTKQALWEKKDRQYIVLTIERNEVTAGYIGISYSVEQMHAISKGYIKRIYIFSWVAGLFGALLFILLFHVFKHNYEKKRLRIMIVAVLIAANLISATASGFILKNGYHELSVDVADKLLKHSISNIERLLDAGVYYSDMQDVDAYFEQIAQTSEQVSAITMIDDAEDSEIERLLSMDGEGEVRYLKADISEDYIRHKVQRSITNVAVTTFTAIMIAVEILIFLLDLLNGEVRERRKKRNNDARETVEQLGIVRGLSFFFASFRFMSVAFMSIVLTEIYRPISIFGYQIPYEIVMSFPMSLQVLISMITSFIAGRVIGKTGWKMPTMIGTMIMMAGTLASALSTEPISFIAAQMLLGTGLGFAKMGMDIYAVSVSSEADMAQYTSNSNAANIVGFSCAASIGALIANIFGYSGAYIVMAIIGLFVLIWIYFFGMDIPAQKQEEAEAHKTETVTKTRDYRFPAYILLVIIPYFFIMMFVDYFFPVFANSMQVTTDLIGYVMLFYGIATAYIGTPICPKLTKRIPAYILMPLILIVLSCGFFAFAFHQGMALAIVIVILIGAVDGIMPSAQFEYVYELPFAKRIGFSQALGIEGFFSSFIGAAAPVVFGVVMMYGYRGLGIIAALVMACSILFLIMNRGYSGKDQVVSEVEK